MDPVLRYDAETDILTLRLNPAPIRDEKLLDNDILLGYDENRELVNVEVWQASKRGLTQTLINLAQQKSNLLEAIKNA